MKILIVDDSSTKIGVVLNALREIPNFTSSYAEYVLDLNSAREKLSKTFYDLLVLDLNMPAELGNIPSMTAGIAFVNEIMDTRRLKKPTDIIILTAFDESAQSFKSQVENAGFIVLQYNEMNAEWRNILHSKVKYLMLCHEQRETIQRLPSADVVLLTTVPVEVDSILSWKCKWTNFNADNDPSLYRFTTLSAEKNSVKIILTQQPEMGMCAAAALTTKLIMHFKPQYVIMTGIAAGLDKKENLGDIIIATDVWNYNSGKYEERTDPDGHKKSILSPDPMHISINKTIEERLTSKDYEAELQNIKLNYVGQAPDHDLHIHFGQLACGGAVVASREIVQEQVKAHARKTIGLDMESYGVCFASQISNSEMPSAIIIKSISDFADPEKGDTAQEYASYTSSSFTKYLIEHILFSEK